MEATLAIAKGIRLTDGILRDNRILAVLAAQKPQMKLTIRGNLYGEGTTIMGWPTRPKDG